MRQSFSILKIHLGPVAVRPPTQAFLGELVFHLSHEFPRLQNSRIFFSESVKKSVTRASHARRACEAREKN